MSEESKKWPSWASPGDWADAAMSQLLETRGMRPDRDMLVEWFRNALKAGYQASACQRAKDIVNNEARERRAYEAGQRESNRIFSWHQADGRMTYRSMTFDEWKASSLAARPDISETTEDAK